MGIWDNEALTNNVSDIDEFVAAKKGAKDKYKQRLQVPTISEEPSVNSAHFDSLVQKNTSPINCDSNVKSKSPKVEFDAIPESTTSETVSKTKISAYYIATLLMDIYDIRASDNGIHIFDSKFGMWTFIAAKQANVILRKLIPDDFKVNVNKSILSEVFSWLFTESKKINEDEFFHNTDYLNFADVAVNYKTRDVLTGEHRKSYFFPYYIPWKYNELQALNNGSFNLFCDNIFKKDKDTKKELAKMMGLAISNIRTLKVSGIFHGLPNSGKSVLLNLIRAMVGEQFSSSISFSQMSSEFALTQLFTKRLNTSAEISGTSRIRLDIFKTLVGNDMTTASFKCEDHFQFKNRCLLLFASNNMPDLDNYIELQPFISRLIVFPFKNQIPRKDWNNNLQNELLGDMKNVFEFAIEGLIALSEDNYEFRETSAMKLAKENFAGVQNSFALFAEKYLIFKPKGKLLSCEIEEYYHAFCGKYNYNCISSQKRSKQLTLFYNCTHYTGTNKSDDNNSKRARGYKGVMFNNNISELYDFIGDIYNIF